MHGIHFYEDRNGNSPLIDYLLALSKRTDKDSRINHRKMNDYIEVLSKYGITAGEPFMKHLDGDIWELRPIRARILFSKWRDNEYILLHYFQFKKTQKTPRREIDQAKRNLEDMKRRSGLQ